jgi:hypothetical protein
MPYVFPFDGHRFPDIEVSVGTSFDRAEVDPDAALNAVDIYDTPSLVRVPTANSSSI